MKTTTNITLLTPAQAAEILHVTLRAMRNLFYIRAFPVVKLASRLYVTEEDLYAYIARQTKPAVER